MLVVNIYGIPGSQKSKFLSNAFSTLSYKNEDCAIIGDFNVDLNKNSFNILGDILTRLNSARSNDVVITNTPLLMQPIYYRQTDLPDPDMFEIIVNQLYQNYNNFNVIVQDPNNSYIYRDLLDLFAKYDIPYSLVKSVDDYAWQSVLQIIINKLKGNV